MISLRIKLLTILSFVFLTAGVCELTPRRSVSLSEIPGMYESVDSTGIEDKLLLREDRTYIRYFTSWDSKSTVDSGKWEIDNLDFQWPEDSAELEIIMSDFILRFTVKQISGQAFYDGPGATVSMRVHPYFGGVRKRTIGRHTYIFIGTNWKRKL